MKMAFIPVVFFVLMFLMQEDTFGQDEPTKRYRLEADLSYEYLTPNNIYGSWKALSIGFYDKPMRDLTYFIRLGAFSRREGEAILGSLGVYKDWGSRLYTYSALSAGSRSDYLPELRIDHDFNIKLGTMKNIVLIAGGSYIDYFDTHRDIILSTGITLYYDRWIWTYRVFRNESDPGSVISYSHLFSAGYGREGWQWTYLDLSIGKQAYLATYLLRPEEVSQDSLYTSLKHRRWIGKRYGIFGDLSYFKLKDGYDKYGFSFGVFREF